MPTKRARDLPVRRGEIVWIDCDPSVSVEPRKTRTCVIVSNDIANHYGEAVTVVPTQAFTRERAERSYMVDLRRPRSTLKDRRLANCSMIMTYDRARIVRAEGKVGRETLDAIDRALSVHLALEPI
jgi:mRNA interferase MazF